MRGELVTDGCTNGFADCGAYSESYGCADGGTD